MPRHPSVDPPLEQFGPGISLKDVVDDPREDQPRQGPAPWVAARRNDFTTTQPSSSAVIHPGMSPLVIGGGVFGTGMYDEDDRIHSEMPTRVLRLAFRYGLNSIDTSPYYYPSEFILGQALRTLAPEFPRSSYYLGTKCGRYGPQVADFDYSPAKIRASILASCSRLGTDYLDTALLHDVEFVADNVGPSNDEGWAALDATLNSRLGETTRASVGLAPGDAARIHGEGDRIVLAAIQELFRLKDEGVVRAVGVSGYPLPTLLRITRLAATTAPFRPLDVLLSYSNQTLHSNILPAYIELLAQAPMVSSALAAQMVKDDAPQQSPIVPPSVDANANFAPAPTYTPPMVLNGSPFSMGLLTDSGPPPWHPASEALLKASRDASIAIREDSAKAEQNNDRGALPDKGLAITALTYGIRGAEQRDSLQTTEKLLSVPVQRTVLGMSTTDHVHAAVHAYRVLLAGAATGVDEAEVASLRPEQTLILAAQHRTQVRHETDTQERMQQAGVQGWSWASPPPDAY